MNSTCPVPDFIFAFKEQNRSNLKDPPTLTLTKKPKKRNKQPHCSFSYFESQTQKRERYHTHTKSGLFGVSNLGNLRIGFLLFIFYFFNLFVWVKKKKKIWRCMWLLWESLSRTLSKFLKLIFNTLILCKFIRVSLFFISLHVFVLKFPLLFSVCVFFRNVRFLLLFFHFCCRLCFFFFVGVFSFWFCFLFWYFININYFS